MKANISVDERRKECPVPDPVSQAVRMDWFTDEFRKECKALGLK